jgi:dTDP-4-amino-4,6-dideoxygalactose transaminase
MNKPARIYMSPPHMGPTERELLLEAFDSNWIAPLGPHVDAFEREFAAVVGCEHAVALSSGTAALHLALILAGIQPGDEIATSTLTFVATANAIRYVGAKPVFIDSQTSDWNLDPNLLEEELVSASKRGKPIKAVLAVDILGQCAAYEPLLEICARYGIPLIEDAAEGLGATYRGRLAGMFGELGAFSFNGNKIITTSGGGMLVTQSGEIAQRARFLATQARDPVPHYEHSVVGYNYRLSNLLAAVGRGQLRVLAERVAQRRANFDYYHQHLSEIPGIDWMPEPAECVSTRWLTCITVDPQLTGVTREEIRLALEAENIEARAVWKPLHRQPAYQDCRARGGAVSERLFETGLCLPSGSSLTENDLSRVVSIVHKTLGHSNTKPRIKATRPNALPENTSLTHVSPLFAKAGGST